MLTQPGNMTRKNSTKKALATTKVKHGSSILELLLPTCIVGSISAAILFYLARNYPITTDKVERVFRVMLSLLTASLGALIPGLLRIDVKQGLGRIRAAGAVAFFLIIYFFNPVSLVSVPARTLSPAKSSATAYYYNYVSPVLEAVSHGRKVKDSKTQKEIEKNVSMIVLIPDKMVDASHTGAKTLLERRFQRASIRTVNRDFSIFSYQPKNGDEVVIIDIPTGLSALRRIIELRLGLDWLDENKNRIAELEEEDIGLFRSTLRLLLDMEHLSSSKVRVMSESELKAYIEQTSSKQVGRR